MRIMHFINDLGYGGAEARVVLLSQHLVLWGYQVAICCLGGQKDIQRPVPDSRIEVYKLNLCSIGGMPLGLARAIKLIRGWRPDIVHTHLVHASIIGRAAAWALGVPVIVSTQHNAFLPKESSILYRVECKTRAMSDCIVAISSSVQSYLLSKGFRGRTEVVRTGLDAESLRAVRLQTTGVLPPYILSVGHLRDQHKGHDILLRAFGKVVRSYPQLRLVVVGDGKLKKPLSELAEEIGIAHSVHLLGLRTDVPALMNNCEIFILASRWEGLGLAAIEAMALGKPVIVSSVEGLREVITHNHNGILVPPENPDALAASLARLLESPLERERLGNEAKKCVEKQWTAGTMARQLTELYEELHQTNHSDS